MAKPKERTLSGPAETPPTRARSSRKGGRNHLGTPSEIKSEWWATSSRIRGRLPPESAAAVPAPPLALPVAVAITPDGKRALVVKGGANRVGLLDIDGQKVTYAQVDGKNYDMATGLNPLNVQITPDGKLAIVNNIGGGQDGGVDTVGVIDLEASPPRVIDQVVVGDGPEGLAMSPAGGHAASLILNGTGGTPKTAFFRHEHSYVALLKIDGKTVRKVAQAEVGGLAEGITFSPDGHFLYVGNFVDGDIDILRLEGDALTKIGSLALSGHPASMRGNTP
jgi:DNA-binding beta-propeller fold protein YncE